MQQGAFPPIFLFVPKPDSVAAKELEDLGTTAGDKWPSATSF
jgi:hypothetical protein